MGERGPKPGTKKPQKSAFQARLAKRRLEVSTRLLAGHTLQKIADDLGESLAVIQRDKTAVVKEWKEASIAKISEKKDRQGQRIEALMGALQEEIFEEVLRPKAKPGEKAPAVDPKDPKKKNLRASKIPAIRAAVALLEREARLFGLDAPVKTKELGDRPVQKMIIGVDLKDI